MSAHHQLFARTTKGPSEIITDLSRAAGIRALDRVAPLDAFDSYRGVTASTVIELEIGHSYEVDRDLRFEDYPVLVTVRDLGRDSTSEARTALGISVALDSFGGYDLLLVFDLQRLVWRNRGGDGRVTT
ncbi:hypothetical protein [Rhodococcoides yunnanense]|uniref:hypothetical protein n=1 Tax=Rhodococcoides yunnanense TaxID=278209 RepID=UPI000933D4D5|nr:hypothetical protein [Rhodococcus yunnanensis]